MTDTPTMTDITPAPNGAPVVRSAYAAKNAEIWKFAEAISRSELVPKHFYGKPANTFLALQLADRMDLDMFAVLTNLFVVHGTPAFSAKFLVGLANLRGPFKGSLRYRVTGQGTPNLAATCYAIHDDGEEASVTVTLAQAKSAGWTKNAKYAEIPEQMLHYRAATFFVRLYCPEVTMMGARTVDEVEDQYASGGIADVEAEPSANPLRAALAQPEHRDGAAPRQAAKQSDEEPAGKPAPGEGPDPRAAGRGAAAPSVLFEGADDAQEDEQ